MNHIAIVGLGYVGLPLSLQFARSGVPVLGLDIDPSKVVMEAKIVPSGVAEVARLQAKEGFVYLKP